jgi:hypothetical protein
MYREYAHIPYGLAVVRGVIRRILARVRSSDTIRGFAHLHAFEGPFERFQNLGFTIYLIGHITKTRLLPS